jgi:hypothetical protein
MTNATDDGATPSLAASALALQAILAGKSKTAEAIRARFHRTVLHRWMTGRARPDTSGRGRTDGGNVRDELHALTRGRVNKAGW